MVHFAQSIKWAKRCFEGMPQEDRFVIAHGLHILAEGVRPETKFPQSFSIRMTSAQSEP